ncbi:hypothetical protein D623_10019770 [Myotis brandtii]|uniref:Uncharacterized protein n=1 Tax=Myotis brandtii TaxID=109478 RepID=S7Q6D9_MYOBR|nr:hypothetical protein D623_10019770 [Myotis brandtii]
MRGSGGRDDATYLRFPVPSAEPGPEQRAQQNAERLRDSIGNFAVHSSQPFAPGSLQIATPTFAPYSFPQE